MPLHQLFHVLGCRMPCVDKLNPKNAVIQIVVAKHIGAETSAYGDVIRRLIIQGKTKIPDMKFVTHLNAIDF